MTEAAISLRLTLNAASDPISGSLTDAHGHTQDFHGWTGLAAALQALIDAPTPRRPAAPTDGEINGFATVRHDPGEHPQ